MNHQVAGLAHGIPYVAVGDASRDDPMKRIFSKRCGAGRRVDPCADFMARFLELKRKRKTDIAATNNEGFSRHAG